MDFITGFNSLRQIGLCAFLYFEKTDYTSDQCVEIFGPEARQAIAEMIDAGRITIGEGGTLLLATSKKYTAKEQVFEDARLAYPGTKDGFAHAFKRMKLHKDWAMCLHLLLPAIQKEAAAKQSQKNRGLHCPDWKHFSTWINQRCWEMTFDVEVESNKVVSQLMGQYLAHKAHNSPNSVPLEERDVQSYLAMDGEFAGIGTIWSKERRSAEFWKAHGVNTKQALLDAIKNSRAQK